MSQPTADERQRVESLVVVQCFVCGYPDLTWNVSTGYSSEDFVIVRGYLRKKDAEIAMWALNDCGIDWGLNQNNLQRQVLERFGSCKEMERWVNEHLQW